MKRLSKEQILLLHSQLIHQTGGTAGVRDFNLLKSAIETPFQVFGGEELYPTIQAKGTRLGYGLIKNHCMLDGNKRIGTHGILTLTLCGGDAFHLVPRIIRAVGGTSDKIKRQLGIGLQVSESLFCMRFPEMQMDII